MVNQSAREIGIRMALGAAPAHVLRSLMARALLETLTGGAVGILAAAALTGILKSQLYQVRALDPAVFVAAPLLLAAIAAAAALLSARHALSVDPPPPSVSGIRLRLVPARSAVCLPTTSPSAAIPAARSR